MGADAWFTLAVLAAMVAILATERAPAAVSVIGAVTTLLVFDVIEPSQALGGFATTAPLTIIALYVIAAAVDKTGALQPLLGLVLRRGGGERARLARLVGPSALASGFLSNTPIVAMLVPPVQGWCERTGTAASKVLIPLSYATILGGVVTVIGTSTNLLVSSQLETTGIEPLDMFELAPIGLPVAATGLATILLLGPKVLPDRRAPRPDTDDSRNFVLSMEVEPGGPLDGETVTDAGLRNLQGLYLVEVERADELIAPVGPDDRLLGGDQLTFVGQAETVVDLQSIRGLRSSEMTHVLAVDDGRHTFFEAVIGTDSPLAHRTLAETEFRGSYQAAVVAIQRSGQRVSGKLGQVKLRPGDTLLLLAGPDFRRRYRNRRDFLLVSKLGGTSPTATRRAPIVLGLLAVVVTLPALGIMDLLRTSLAVAGALLLLGILTTEEARDGIQLNVVAMIGAAFGLGEAMRETGLSERIAEGLLDSIGSLGDIGAIVALVLLTLVLTELITNGAAAVIAVEIALQVSGQTDLDPRILAIGVAVTASCSFITPIGYQTNTMVYGPGGYRYTDYMRLGGPLSAVVVVTVVTMTAILA